MKRHFPIRILCVLCAAALLCGSGAVVCPPTTEIAVSVPQASSGGVKIREAVTLAADAAGAVPYVSDAAMNELRGIVTYALGGDPNEGKSPEDAGQNTKNNVAISLLWVQKSLRGAYSVRFVLEPYAGKDNVYELIAYVRRVFRKGEERVRTGWLYDRAKRQITTEDGTGMMGIGYDFNYDFNTFSAASDAWQRNFGFCRMYDDAAFLIGDVYQTIRVPFRYDGKDWMIQIWKGVYSWNMLGGEVALYNKPVDRKEAFYDCATDTERIPMAFSVSCGDETIIRTELATSWWQTAFTQHRLVRPRDLSMEFTLTFPNSEMLRAFTQSLQTAAPDVTIRRSGLTATCFWPSGK